ncbi:hypothetical protein BC830DRAFT_673911 [Chytriomyces sp. MP71]|nr:hypothetical protein BC830DRAFT_673911 [Chytriomyces sp. MP71]
MDAVNDGVVVGESESEGGDGAATVTVIVPSSLSSDVVFPTVLSLSSSLSSSSSSEVAADATVVASTMVSPPPPPPPPHPITPFPRQQNFSESSSISEVEVAASVAENDIGASQNKQNNRTEPDHATTSLDALDSSSPSVTKNITTPAYLRDAGSIQAAEDANMRTNDDSDSELPPFAASFKPHPNSKPLAFVAHSQPPATSASHTTSSSVHTFSGSDAEDESESRRIPSTTAAVKKKKRHHSSSSGSSGIYIATTESTSHSHPFPSTSKPTPIVSTSISAKTPKLPSTSTSKRPSPKSESAETLATAAVRPKEPRFRTITDERDIESIFRSVPIPDSDSNDGDFVLEGFVSSSGVKGSGKRRTSSGSFFEKGNAEKGSLSEKGVSSAKRKEGLLSGYVAVDGKGGEKQSSSNVRDSVKTSSESLKESAKESKAKEAKDRPKSALATLAVKKEASASTSSKMDAPKQEIGQEFIRKQAEAHRKLEQETLSSPRTAPPAKSKPTALKPTKPKRDEEDEIGASSGAEGGSSGGEGGGTVRVEVNLRAKKEPTAPKRKAGRPPSGGGGPKAPNRTDVIMIANKAIPLSAINNTDRSGRTPLFRVSGNGDTSAVTALIRAGADVNAKDNAGWSPLHEACLEGQLETATLLIRYGADVNAQGFDHVTPLHDAVESNHYEVVELLLSHGASLAAQTRQGHTPSDGVEDETMAQILQLWRRMTAKVLEVDAEGLTLLHTYAMRGDIKQVRRVLKYGAEVDFACHAGWTPLHEAAGKGFVEVVEELCRYGAVVDARNLDLGTGAAFEITPLMDAAAAGHAGVARMLLEFGADLEAKDSEGRTALDYAEGEDVKELLKRPAETWKPPLRTPDFIKSKPGNVGMMARIRDQASERLARSEATGNKDPR